jgi:hypothetical protein
MEANGADKQTAATKRIHARPYRVATRIRAEERDRVLHLGDSHWPSEELAPPGWEVADDRLRRVIAADGDRFPVELEESVLRFPSAPLHSLQRLHEHPVKLGAPETFHTYRVLQTPQTVRAVRAGSEGDQPNNDPKRVRRIYLIHCGLNERDTMGLHYQLASQLIAKRPNTACVIRPFPGHLTRYPFQAFAETPLDRYLSDGSHLFRQFMRFMIETQWFLSTLARRSSYRCASGANLLSESQAIASSRVDNHVLAEDMREAWMRLHDVSDQALEDFLENQKHAAQLEQDVPDVAAFEQSIRSLRELLELEQDYPSKSGDFDPDDADEPDVHVLGYSLGGFAAQSVFMSWPFLIASCSTLLAGGALRELAPTAFADPEEWQTVLHSLRYELDDRLMSRHLDVSGDSVAGVDIELFTHFKRTFYEVFQQEYRGAFQTRVAAFRQRMLFIVGGNDPVVQPRRVLDSGPPGGMNLLEVGGLGHFFPDDRRKGGGGQQDHQRAVWLPEMASLIDRVADEASARQKLERAYTWFAPGLAKPVLPKSAWDAAFEHVDGSPGADELPVRPLTSEESVAIGDQGALPADLFTRFLDDLLWRVATHNGDGVLFILRNEVPTVMMSNCAVREKAAAMFHDDYAMVQYCHGVQARKEVIYEHRGRIGFIVPWNLKALTLSMDSLLGYPSQSEGAGGHVEVREPIERIWDDCVGAYRRHANGAGKRSIRIFDGHVPFAAASRIEQPLRDRANHYAANETLSRVATLPDCWLWVSRRFLTPFTEPPIDIDLAVGDLLQAVPKACQSTKDLERRMRDGDLRLITVSKARYNPRFRGRLIVNPTAARKLLVHIALCIGMSEPILENEMTDRLGRSEPAVVVQSP